MALPGQPPSWPKEIIVGKQQACHHANKDYLADQNWTVRLWFKMEVDNNYPEAGP